ncbi:MAG: hypothetical protein J0I06_21225 [Planctomycetes bacterium]|nr:hypothetical protein [Planctomycetota bacterium]
MAEDDSDLWPADIVVDVVPPVAILNEQAEALAKKTQGIVKGEVRSNTTDQFEQLSFDLVAPAVGLRQRILLMRFVRDFPYPVVLIAAPLTSPLAGSSGSPEARDLLLTWKLSDAEQRQARLAHTPREVRELLKTIFNAPATRGALFSLIARSNEVTGVTKGEGKETETPQHSNGKSGE